VVAILNLVSGACSGYCGVGDVGWVEDAHPIKSANSTIAVLSIANLLKNLLFIGYPPCDFLIGFNAFDQKTDKFKRDTEMFRAEKQSGKEVQKYERILSQK